MINELELLLRKVRDSEDLVQRAEDYFKWNAHQWSGELAAYFQDFLARKKDQIEYEWDRIGSMGSKIAAERARRALEERLDE